MIHPRTVGLGVLAACLTGGLVTLAPLSATPRSAPAPTTVQLTSTLARTTSSTGHKLAVALIDQRVAEGGPTYSLLVITVMTPSKNEQHQWEFESAGSAMTVNSHHAATLTASAAKSGGYATVHLKFTPAGKAKSLTCEGTHVSTTYKGTLAGTLRFVTHSSGTGRWGSVGSTTKKFTFPGSSLLAFDYQGFQGGPCSQSTPIVCFKGLQWNPTGMDSPIEGQQAAGKTTGPITATRTVNLTSPKNATRTDLVIGTAKEILDKNADGTATLVIEGVTSSAGKANIPSILAGNTTMSTCGGHKLTRTEYAGTVQNYKPEGLAVDAQVFGKIGIPDGTDVTFIHWS